MSAKTFTTTIRDWDITTATSADALTQIVLRTTTGTSTLSQRFSAPTDHVIVEEEVNVNILIEIPMTCEDIMNVYASQKHLSTRWPGVVPNSDIAGVGVRTYTDP